MATLLKRASTYHEPDYLTLVVYGALQQDEAFRMFAEPRIEKVRSSAGEGGEEYLANELSRFAEFMMPGADDECTDFHYIVLRESLELADWMYVAGRLLKDGVDTD